MILRISNNEKTFITTSVSDEKRFELIKEICW